MISIHFLCLGFFGFSAPHLREGIIQEHSQREEERGREGGRKRQRGGIVSSHCSIKSVSNDQDEMMAIFLL